MMSVNISYLKLNTSKRKSKSLVQYTFEYQIFLFTKYKNTLFLLLFLRMRDLHLINVFANDSDEI